MIHSSTPHSPPSLRGRSWLERREAQAVFAALAAAGHEARAVGGAVRNALMQLPVGDVDIATTARPDAVMAAARAAGLACIGTGVEHGTVTVVAAGVPFEVTTLRADVETYGRHARVEFSTDWAADARRRDFTINALYCTADGTVIDPLGGYPDVVQRRVVFVGEPRERIREDYLRILRFFRFHAEYGNGAPERAALDACVRERHGLAHLSAERVRAELIKLLGAPHALSSLGAMHDFGLLSAVLGAAPRLGLLARLVGQEAELGAPPDALLRLSAVAVATEEDAERLAGRLRLSNAERATLLIIDGRVAALATADIVAARRALYRAGGEAAWRRLVLAAGAADGQVAPSALSNLLDLPLHWPVPQFPLRGADVLAAGVRPGPEVGHVLRDLEGWWVERDFAPDEPALRARLAQMIRPQ